MRSRSVSMPTSLRSKGMAPAKSNFIDRQSTVHIVGNVCGLMPDFHPLTGQHEMACSHPNCLQLAGTVALSIAALSTQPLSGAQYYFSSLGNDQTGNGTQLNPWRTINKFNALDLEPGDNVFFRSGDIFAGSLLLNANDSGTNADGELIAPITISSYGGGPSERAIIRSHPTTEAFLANNNGGIELRNLEFFNGGTPSSNSASGIRFGLDQEASGGLTRYQHIRIDNVVARGFHHSGISFQATGSVGYQDVEITNSEFFDNEFAGIDIGASTYWRDLIHRDFRIDGVVAHSNAGFAGCKPHCGHGIVLAQVDGAAIRNSIAHSNGIAAGKGNVGIWAWHSNDVTIEHNRAFGNRSPLGGDGGGFDIDGGVTNSVVQFNASQDNDGAGFLLAEFSGANPMQQNVFRYNLSLNDGVDQYGAFTIWGADSDSIASTAIFHNNTAIVDKSIAPDSRGTVWFVNSNHDDIDLINNLFVALNGAALIDGDTSLERAQFTNNAYWTGGGPIRIGETTFDSIAGWAAASQQETMNEEFIGVEADPNFGSFGVYVPLPPSLLIDAGLPPDGEAWPDWFGGLGSVDYYGTPVPQGPGFDIGAGEFGQLPGDYNSDGTVDAADYVVWRKSLDQTGMGLAADGNRDEIVDGGDYDIWRAYFGWSTESGSVLAGPAANVPEPATGLLFVWLVSCLFFRDRRDFLAQFHPTGGDGAAK